jgi:hypothetical protein
MKQSVPCLQETLQDVFSVGGKWNLLPANSGNHYMWTKHPPGEEGEETMMEISSHSELAGKWQVKTGRGHKETMVRPILP